MNIKKLLFIIVLSVALGGCATILQPGPDHIAVNSAPSGAKVYLDGQPIGSTPMVASVNRNADGRFRIEADGYEPITVNRDKVVSGWVFVDVLCPVVCLIVDLATHDQGHYSEDPIFMDLKSKQPLQLSSQKPAVEIRKPASKP